MSQKMKSDNNVTVYLHEMDGSHVHCNMRINTHRFVAALEHLVRAIQFAEFETPLLESATFWGALVGKLFIRCFPLQVYRNAISPPSKVTCFGCIVFHCRFIIHGRQQVQVYTRIIKNVEKRVHRGVFFGLPPNPNLGSSSYRRRPNRRVTVLAQQLVQLFRLSNV
jgi:hypothetical protein